MPPASLQNMAYLMSPSCMVEISAVIELLHVCDRVGALEPQLAHVRHVKESRLLPHGHVLGEHTGGILHGHQKAAELNDLSARVHMRSDTGVFSFP